MEVNFLELLEAKPTPLKVQEVEIVLPGDIDTKIVDKTGEGYDGDALRKRLLKFQGIELLTSPEEEEEEEEEEEPSDVDSAAPSAAPSAPSAAPSAPSAPSAAASSEEEDEEKDEEEDDDVASIPSLSSDEDGPAAAAASPISEEEIQLDIPINMKGTTLESRIPIKPPKRIIEKPSYFMNNRKMFIEFITSLMLPYRRELADDETNISCEGRGSGEFSLLTHQKLVRDYINIFTPYRGLLLYHGLGSGKTCSSIAIAEGLKDPRRIIIMTPASLQMNYRQELKKCGDTLYKINQYWEFISTTDNNALAHALAKVLSIPLAFINKKGGAWFVNIKRKANYSRLNSTKRKNIDEQVNKMIEAKYFFINYNGIRESHLARYQKEFGHENIFDDAVIIIDEIHNFVSRIVNKLKYPKSLSMQLYEYLKKAKHCKIIGLTGTPVINYPNEIAILFNMIRGYIQTYTFPLIIKTQKKVNEKTMKKMLKQLDIVDYIRYQSSLKQLVVTRNPMGFINAEKPGEKIVNNIEGMISDVQFKQKIIDKLAEHNISVNEKHIITTSYTALPDKLENFKTWFINKKSGTLQNVNIFKKRILGLTSHFRSAQEQLMPRFNKKEDFHVVEIPMSDYQLNLYEKAREGERKLEKQQAKRNKRRGGGGGGEAGEGGQGVYKEGVSTYRIFSRAFCNFVFPGEIKRPFPQENVDLSEQININTNILDNVAAEEQINEEDGELLPEDLDKVKEELEKKVDSSYAKRLIAAIKNIDTHKEEYLSKAGLAQLSPKFLAIITNIEENRGLHLVYSQFRTLEGIGILKFALEANGFAQFRISKSSKGKWNIIMREEDRDKPKFILYTGTETTEEKEIVRNIFNSTWNNTPRSIRKQLQQLGTNNNHGEIARVFMITAAGAEGISLRNVQYVHLMEPYWHPVRTEQVVGRARRICSHQDLPEEERKVDVYLYLMRFTETQITDLLSIELKIHDTSKLNNKNILTSDQALYEISSIKERINDEILNAIKETSIDCALQMREDEDLTCFSFSDPKPDQFAYTPQLTGGEDDDIGKANLKEKVVKIKFLTYGTTRYAYNTKTKEVYDFKSYQLTKNKKNANPIVVGKIVTDPKTKKKKIQFK